jgi:hypothetical protein
MAHPTPRDLHTDTDVTRFLEHALELSWSETVDHASPEESELDRGHQNVLREAFGLEPLSERDLGGVKSRRAASGWPWEG